MPRQLLCTLCLLALPLVAACGPPDPGTTAGEATPAPPAASPPAAAAASPEPSATLPARLEIARDDFTKYCASCHGDGGRGDGPMGRFIDPKPKDLTDAAYMRTRTDEQIYSAIHDGGESVGLSDKMAAWSHLLSEEQIRELAEYVRWLSEG